MSLVGKSLAGVGLLAIALAGAGLVDRALNDGRLTGFVLGSDRLVAACTPALIKHLSDAGFSPQDIEVDRPSGLTGVWGMRRTLEADFTFQDGAEETRIDGVMSCIVDPPEVRIVVRTSGRPVRAG